jgi:hypothetical protein
MANSAAGEAFQAGVVHALGSIARRQQAADADHESRRPPIEAASSFRDEIR